MLRECDAANNRLSFLHRYSGLLDFRTRKLLCTSLVLSKLSYCISAWYPGLGAGLRSRLDVAQRKMVRFIRGWTPREHVGEPEIKSIGWLLFPKRALLFQLTHLFKVKIGLAPTYLSRSFCPTTTVHQHDTRGSSHNFTVNNANPVGSFHYTTVREWNQLPIEVKSATSLLSFRKKLRQHFMS